MLRKTKTPLSQLDTYVFIDTSNIRASCLKTLSFKIDFKNLFQYFQKKYHNLQEVYYYEGIARGGA